MARTKRAQVLMEPEEYARLEELAAQRRCSVAELIRVAVQERYLIAVDDRLAAVEELLSVSVPVGDWNSLKAEIEGKHVEAVP